MLPSKIEELEKVANEAHAKAYGNPDDGQQTEAPAPENEERPEEELVKPLKAKNPEKENDPEYWKRRAELMAGKYDAEVPRFAEENRKLKERLEELERQKQTPEAPKQETVLDEELVDRYGEEFIRDIQRLLPSTQMPTTNAEVAQLKAEIDRLKAAQHDISFERFTADLSKHAKDWEKLNTDSDFNLWLDGMDPASGLQRRQLFNTAVSSSDVQRTAYFFNTFTQQNQSWDETPKSQVPPADHYMAPQQSKAQQSPQGKKIWSSSEVAKFYDDVRRGRLDDDAASRIEQDIIAAQREGRYR